MRQTVKKTYSKYEAKDWAYPNRWDFIAGFLILGLLVALGWSARHMIGHFVVGDVTPISLQPTMLPYYASRTFLRLLVALFFSLLFTFTVGTWAAKSRYAERIIIPLIDVLQSVPVLGFLSITVVGFIALFQGSILGPECAAIFAIFIAQVWNMTLSFYQSLSTIPKSLREATEVFQLSAWQRFWRLEVPFALPSLLWNMMMSMSGSWVFLVASEAITVAKQNILLPGIGSYIAVAIQQANTTAIWWVIIAVFAVILLYDQLLFRPLIAWAEKFKAHHADVETEAGSWVLDMINRARFWTRVGDKLSIAADWFIDIPWLRDRSQQTERVVRSIRLRQLLRYTGHVCVILSACVGLYAISSFLYGAIPLNEYSKVMTLGLLTTLRVCAVTLLSSLIWIPIGVWVGRHPNVMKWVQPVAQFLAAFPANLLFPVVTLSVIHYHLDINIWSSLLMMIGTQWYILFNVVAGASATPNHLYDVVGTFNVRGWLRWRRFILPSIFPYYITGAITAAGAAWNMSIIAEAVDWGRWHLRAAGLGAYMTEAAQNGDFHRLVLSIVMMSLYVFVINRLLWRPLQRLSESRFLPN